MQSQIFGKSNIVSLCVSLLVCFSKPTCADEQFSKLEKQKWVEVSSPHFRIITDLSQKKAATIAAKLEQFRKMYMQRFAAGLDFKEKRIKIIAPKRSAIFDLFLVDNNELSGVNGFFVTNNSGNYAAVEANRFNLSDDGRGKLGIFGASRLSTPEAPLEQNSLNGLFHEYSHFLAYNQHQSILPYWYSEGFADYLSMAKIVDKDRVFIGQQIAYHLRELNSRPWVSVEQLLKSTRSTLPDQSTIFRIYAQGWLMVHYFLAKPERALQLEHYLAMIAAGSSVDEATQTAFSSSYQQLDTVIRKYAKRGKIYYQKVSLHQAENESKISVRELGRADLMFEFGDHFLSGLGLPGKAKSYFQRSIEIQPENGNALAGLAKVHQKSNLELAKKNVEQALQLETITPFIHTVAGEIAAQEFAVTESPAARDRAVSHLRIAINLQAGNVAAISALGGLHIKEANFDLALELFETAYELAPTSSQARYDVIVANYSVGNFERGDSIAEIVRRNPHNSATEVESFNNWATTQRNNAHSFYEQQQSKKIGN